MFDIIVIILSIVFVLIALLVQLPDSVENVLKIRSIFRLLRVFLLVRKLNALRIKREQQKKNRISLASGDIRSPLERVLEILNDVRDRLDPDEEKIMLDVNYVVKIIASNKLYEMDIEDDGSTKSEVMNWYQNYSQQR